MTVNTSSPTVAKVMRKPKDERSAVISFFCFYCCVKGGWALPNESAVLEGEESCTLVLRCVFCLLGNVMVVAVVAGDVMVVAVVAVVVNSLWV